MRALIRFCTCLIIVFICCGCAAKRALVVTQYADGSPRANAAVAALEKAFETGGTSVRWTVFNMDTQCHPTERWRDVRGEMAVMRANNALKSDIVFSVGDEAARYFAQRLAGTQTRIIFFGVKGAPDDYDFVMASNVTGVHERVPVLEAFSLLKELVPTAATVAVLADRSLEGDAVVKQIRATSDLPLRVTEVRRAGTLQEWMTTLIELQGEVDALCIASYGTILRSPDGRDAVPPAELLRKTAEVNHVPDFSFWEDAVGPEGVMAAAFVPIASQAGIAARMAQQVLYDGMQPGRFEIETCAEHGQAFSMSRAALFGVVLPAPVEVPLVEESAPEAIEEDAAPETQEGPDSPE